MPAGDILGPCLVWLGQQLLTKLATPSPGPALLPAGTVVAISGSNLAGKTTLADALLAANPHCRYLSEHHTHLPGTGREVRALPYAAAAQAVADAALHAARHEGTAIVDAADPAQLLRGHLARGAPGPAGVAHGRVHAVNVLVFLPLEAIPDRQQAARAAAEPPLPVAWRPSGGFSATWLPYVHFGALYTGRAADPGRAALQPLRHDAMAAALVRSAQQAVRDGLHPGDVEQERAVVQRYLERALGLQPGRRVWLFPRATYDLVVTPSTARPAALIAKLAEQHHEGALTPAPHVPHAGLGAALLRSCEQCLHTHAHRLCHDCVTMLSHALSPSGGLDHYVAPVASFLDRGIDRLLTHHDG